MVNLSAIKCIGIYDIVDFNFCVTLLKKGWTIFLGTMHHYVVKSQLI